MLKNINYNRYNIILGNQATDSLVESSISVSARIVQSFVSIDDTEKLISDLQNDELVRNELFNLAELLVLKGGQFVALASGLFHAIRNVKSGIPPDNPNIHTKVEFEDPAIVQILLR